MRLLWRSGQNCEVGMPDRYHHCVYLQSASNVVDKSASVVRLGVVKHDPAAYAVFPQESNEAQKAQGKASSRPSEGGILNQAPIIFPMPNPPLHSPLRSTPT